MKKNDIVVYKYDIKNVRKFTVDDFHDNGRLVEIKYHMYGEWYTMLAIKDEIKVIQEAPETPLYYDHTKFTFKELCAGTNSFEVKKENIQ